MPELRVNLKPQQDKFLFSTNRYPGFVAGVGTGKTMMLLLKIWRYCEQYDNSLALVVRKEFTDLRDSTLKDFEAYFGVSPNSDKEYKFPNGSVIMFRHGAELNVLKNVNLSIFGVEQAEEFETEETFTYLRDRLRRPNAPYRQGCLIANTNGHNWIWKLWKNNPTEEFTLSEMNTFDNADNLPLDFVNDLKRMEIEAPNHYYRYVMNSWEELSTDDIVFSYKMIEKSIKLDFLRIGTLRRALGVDVSRYGDDDTVFTMLESRGVLQWEQTLLEVWTPKMFRENRLMQIVGKTVELNHLLHPDVIGIDDDGLGGGVTDRLGELKLQNIFRFQAGVDASKKETYANRRTEVAFETKELIEASYLKLLNNLEQMDELMTLKFFYQSDRRKMLVPKEKLRAEGIKSPNKADALLIAVSCTKIAMDGRLYEQTHLPRSAMPDDTDLSRIVNPFPSRLPQVVPVVTYI